MKSFIARTLLIGSLMGLTACAHSGLLTDAGFKRLGPQGRFSQVVTWHGVRSPSMIAPCILEQWKHFYLTAKMVRNYYENYDLVIPGAQKDQAIMSLVADKADGTMATLKMTQSIKPELIEATKVCF